MGVRLKVVLPFGNTGDKALNLIAGCFLREFHLIVVPSTCYKNIKLKLIRDLCIKLSNKNRIFVPLFK